MNLANLLAAIALEGLYQATRQQYRIVPSRSGWFRLGQKIIAAHPEYLLRED